MKKIIALVLLISLTTFASAQTTTESLYEFLKTTTEITARYDYPSYKLSANASGKRTLAAHTPIVIRNESAITTKNIISGDSVNFSIVQDVKDNNGYVLIKKGTPVSANISFKKQGMIGRSGEITVTDFHTKAVDGSYIPLSSTISATPDDKMVLSIVLSVCICPLFLLMKGENAELPAGTTKTAYTINDCYIKANAY